ncbi:MAG: tRNA (adenosine(37)-N6)-threonylcarbamoyltransferase complex dimerization subunit type 1 TsaB, partial [Mycobacterium sp.]
SYPTPAGLIAAVTEWPDNPAPLVPLYLRRPDAKTLAEREAASR